MLNKYNSYYKDQDGNEYDDSDLWELAKNCKVNESHPHTIFSSLSTPEIRLILSILSDCERIRDCDLQYPIILTPDGYLADGYHRLIKSFLNKNKIIKYVHLDKMPKPRVYK